MSRNYCALVMAARRHRVGATTTTTTAVPAVVFPMQYYWHHRYHDGDGADVSMANEACPEDCGGDDRRHHPT